MQQQNHPPHTHRQHAYSCLRYLLGAICLMVISLVPLQYTLIQLTDKLIMLVVVFATVTSLCIYYMHKFTDKKRQRVNVLSESPARQVCRFQTIPSSYKHLLASQTWPVSRVSVLFADLQGYTMLARALGDEKTVAVLHRLYCEFDTYGMKFGITKIKTNGDEYMAAAGLANSDNSNPIYPNSETRCLSFAFSLLTIIRTLNQDCNQDLSIRVGIATGPVTAGFIGRYGRQFDIWGNTVNRASRLERTARANTICICDTTAERVYCND